MEPIRWTPPPIGLPDPSDSWAPRRRSRLVVGLGLVGAGAVAGAIIGATVLSNAATSTPSAPGTGSSITQPDGHGPGHGGPGHGLDLSGTVTAVGASSVAIKTSTATTTYQVTSSSDIDKNGEAKLSDLKVGDAVRFNVNGTAIDKLHAGNEALDRPQGPPPGDSSGG